MTDWLLPALLALFSFGLWGFFTKLTIYFVDAKSAFLYQTLGVLIAGLFILHLIAYKPAYDTKGIAFGILTGLAYGIGCLCYFFAVDRGKLITIVTLTALYPLITIVLSLIFLKETIQIKQWIGIAFALIAMWLLAS